MTTTKLLLAGIFFSTISYGQKNIQYADSILKTYTIPEISYAVISCNSILEIASVGHHSVDLKDSATLNDRFHIGSNTKAMTAFIIAKYVESKKLSWDTKFFDLFPSWRENSNSAYAEITLQDLLSHRARIQPFRGQAIPHFKGCKPEKRVEFGRYVLTLDPVKADSINNYFYSNAGYTLATLMLECVSGKNWEQLVSKVFNEDLKIDAQLSWPENQKNKGTWGHLTKNDTLVPVPSTTYYLLDYTEPAGDINITIAGYVKFVQLNLEGLKGKNNYLKSETYLFMHRGIADYSIGWFNHCENGNDFSIHPGTLGTYYTLVAIDRKNYVGYIIFTNSFNKATVTGVGLLLKKLKANYAEMIDG